MIDNTIHNQTVASIGERIEAARKSLGMTQVQMTTHLGIAISTYQICESPRANPKVSVIAGLVELGISSDWLVTGQGEMLLADRGQAPDADDDSNEVIKSRALLFDLIVGMEAQAHDSGLELTPQQHADMILFMTDLVEDGELPKMTPRIQRQMMKLVGG
jgi:transcriptional regulator with XRE-family HTH domain